MTPKPKTYSFKDHPEHEKMMPEWRDKWISNAMSTAAMTEEDRASCRIAVNGLYAAANLPPPKHIVFVPSPFVLAFAGGFAAARWHMSKGMAATEAATRAATREATRAATDTATWEATRAATEAATLEATDAATDTATRAATWAATEAATEAATRAATAAATREATRAAATRAATEAATRNTNYSNWYVVPADMRRLATELGVADFGLQCAAQAWRMWQGGNQWSGYDAYLSFFKDVAGLKLTPHASYQHWQTLAERSGPRIVHPDFCMISDRPELLTVDDENRPHAENGPFCRWRDGTELYSWHGVRVPAKWIIGGVEPAEVIKERDVELRAAGAAIAGWPKMLSVLESKIIDDSGSDDIGQLIELTLPGLREPGRFLKAVCPRNGIIVEGVPRVSDIDGLPIDTALAAQAWRIGDPQSEYCHPPERT